MATDSLAIVILAGGRGKRMHSELPKVLIPTRQAPLITHVLRSAAALSPDQLIVVVGYRGDLVAEVAQREASKLNINLRIARQPEQLGTGDAARHAMAELAEFSGTVLILLGDAPLVRTETLKRLLDEHKRSAASLSMLSFEPENPSPYGRIVRNSKSGALEKIVEAKDCTPTEREIGECNSGICVVNSDLLREGLKSLTNNNIQKEYYLTDIVAFAAAKGQNIAAVIGSDPNEFEGVNTTKELSKVNQIILDRKRNALLDSGVKLEDPQTTYIDEAVTISPDVCIGPNTTIKGASSIEAGAVIEGNAYIVDCTVRKGALIKFSVRAENATIGANAVIGPFANIRPGTILEDSVHVGNFVETKKAHIKEGSKANHLSYLGDCTVGTHTNIGAGTITCNYDGYSKHKTEIGSNVHIGSHTCLVAPVVVEDGASIGAGSVVRDSVPAEALMLTRGELVVKAGWAKAKREKAKQKS